MAETNCKDYTGITRESIDKWREETARSGAPAPEGDSFTIEKSGVKVSIEYNEPISTVKVCIVDKPSFIPDAMVWAIIDAQMQPPS